MTPSFTFGGSVPQNYDACLGPFMFEPYAVDMVQRIKQEGVKTVLELACGTGRLTSHLCNLFSGETELTATDLHEGMLTVARQQVPHKRVHWQVADAQHLPFQNDYFDLLLCQFGIMFFPDKEVALREANRVLRRGAQLLFSTWDRLETNPVNVLVQQTLSAVLNDKTPDFMEKGPFSFYQRDEITTLVAAAGFKQIQLEEVPLTGTMETAATGVKGFLTGSPLAPLVASFNEDLREELSARLLRTITAHYGEENLQIPMQAIVCSAVK